MFFLLLFYISIHFNYLFLVCQVYNSNLYVAVATKASKNRAGQFYVTSQSNHVVVIKYFCENNPKKHLTPVVHFVKM